MKLDNRRTSLGVALAVFAAEVQGALNLPFEDKSTYGVVTVGVGSPATRYELLITTGSSNTWVGARAPYIPTSTSKDTGNTVFVEEEAATFSGNQYLDSLSFSGATFQQSIGVAKESKGYDGVDGVLGLGPAVLSLGTLSPAKNMQIPTVADSLLAAGAVDSATITLANGILSFGSPLLEISNIIYAPITQTTPSSSFWGFDASFTYGDASLGSTVSGIIDYSTTLILLDKESFAELQAVSGAEFYNDIGLLGLPTCDGLSPLVLAFGGSTLDIPVEQYIIPTALNASFGGRADICYLGVQSTGAPPGDGVDFVIGYNTLKHFTVVLDKENSRVGISSFAIQV